MDVFLSPRNVYEPPAETERATYETLLPWLESRNGKFLPLKENVCVRRLAHQPRMSKYFSAKKCERTDRWIPAVFRLASYSGCVHTLGPLKCFFLWFKTSDLTVNLIRHLRECPRKWIDWTPGHRPAKTQWSGFGLMILELERRKVEKAWIRPHIKQ